MISSKIIRSAATSVSELALIAVIGISIPTTVYASPGPVNSAAPGVPPQVKIEDIVVTATRREERLQNVSASITALSSDQLLKSQVTDVRRLAALAPSLTYAQTPQDPTDIAIGIRGLFIMQAQVEADPVVGVYIDGLYLSRTSGANTGFVDMQRVEVLRGPQGTLFGRNTIGGALNIVTNKPTDRLEGSLSLDFGNYNTRNATAILNVPILDDKIDARFVYQHQEHSGFGRDTFLNEDLNDLNQDFFRGSLRLKPSENWTVLLTGDYMRLHNHSQLVKLGYVVPGSTADVRIPALNGHPADTLSNYLGGDFYQNQAGFDPMINIKTWSTIATIDGRLGSINFRSISGYHGENANRPGSNTGTPYPVFDLPDKPFRYHEISQEFQLFGDSLDNQLHWLGGLYYFVERGRQGQIIHAFGGLLPNSTQNDTKVQNQSESAFGQVTFDFSPTFSGTAGARYTKEQRDASYFDNLINNTTGAHTCALPVFFRNNVAICEADVPRAKFSYVPFTVGLNYKPNTDTLLYAKLSRGYRSGGLPQTGTGVTAPAQALPFGTENVLSPEVGSKLEFFDRRVRLNTAVYYTKYNDIQQIQSLPGPTGAPINVTTNSGNARIFGGEMELQATLDRLQFRGGLGLTYPKYIKGPLVGAPFIQVSKVTASTGIDYSLQTPLGTVDLNGDYVWQSTQHFFIPTNVASLPASVNAAATAATTQKGYGLLSAMASLELKELPLTISLWTRNLTNKQYKARAADYVTAGLGIVPFQPGDPRTFGATISYKFGSK